MGIDPSGQVVTSTVDDWLQVQLNALNNSYEGKERGADYKREYKNLLRLYHQAKTEDKEATRRYLNSRSVNTNPTSNNSYGGNTSTINFSNDWNTQEWNFQPQDLYSNFNTKSAYGISPWGDKCMDWYERQPYGVKMGIANVTLNALDASILLEIPNIVNNLPY